MTLIRQSEYARRLGVSRAAVTQWKAAGSLVMSGELVDVEQSDTRLMLCRREGLPAIVDCGAGEMSAQTGRRGHPPRSGLALLSRAAIAQRLTMLDWRQTFDWSDEAQRGRARLAARCVGLEAAESRLVDDGHWRGFQLRDPAEMGDAGEVTEAAVRAGFGYELSAAEVITLCREEVEPMDRDDDGAVLVDLALLPLLAHPHYPSESRGRRMTPGSD